MVRRSRSSMGGRSRPATLIIGCLVVASLVGSAACSGGASTDNASRPSSSTDLSRTAATKPADHPPGSSAPSTSTATTDVILRWTAEGGLCPDGRVCAAGYEIRADGTWTSTTDTSRGTLGGDLLKELTDAMSDGVASLRSLRKKDVRSCPSAADGSDITVTFETAQGPVTISNCDVIFDVDNPVLAAWNRVREAVG